MDAAGLTPEYQARGAHPRGNSAPGHRQLRSSASTQYCRVCPHSSTQADCAAMRISGRKGLHPKTRARARCLVLYPPRPPRPKRPAGVCGTAQRRHASSVDSDGRPVRCHDANHRARSRMRSRAARSCTPWTPPHVHRLGLNLPLGLPIHPHGSGPDTRPRETINSKKS